MLGPKQTTDVQHIIGILPYITLCKKNTSPEDKTTQLSASLKEKVTEADSKINTARLQLMSMVIIALCKIQTLSFHKLALAFDTDSQVDSSLRRLQRFIRLIQLNDIFCVAKKLNNLTSSTV